MLFGYVTFVPIGTPFSSPGSELREPAGASSESMSTQVDSCYLIKADSAPYRRPYDMSEQSVG
jgi:hypothetical protein